MLPVYSKRSVFTFMANIILAQLLNAICSLPPVIMASKPTVALVPGAWHTPVHFDILISFLDAEGYPTVSKQLPSVDTATPATTTSEGDSQFIIDQVLTPLLDDGKDVVLVAHSYGGCPAGAAANGLSKAERTAAGKKGGIIGLIWIAAYIAPSNVSVYTLASMYEASGKVKDWIEHDVSRPLDSSAFVK